MLFTKPQVYDERVPVPQLPGGRDPDGVETTRTTLGRTGAGQGSEDEVRGGRRRTGSPSAERSGLQGVLRVARQVSITTLGCPYRLSSYLFTGQVSLSCKN